MLRHAIAWHGPRTSREALAAFADGAHMYVCMYIYIYIYTYNAYICIEREIYRERYIDSDRYV